MFSVYPLWNWESGSTFVNAAVFESQEVSLAVACGYPNCVFLRNKQSGQAIRSLVGHTAPITAVAYSPDGQTFASGSQDQTVRVWDVVSGQTIRSLVGHTAPVSAVAYSPDGQTLASGSQDQTVRVWEAQSLTPEPILLEHTAPINTVVYTVDSTSIIIGDEHGFVVGWNLAAGNVSRIVGQFEETVTSIAIDYTSELLAVGILRGEAPVTLWNAVSGEFVLALPVGIEEIARVTFDVKGTMLMCSGTGRTGGRVELWEMTRTQA